MGRPIFTHPLRTVRTIASDFYSWRPWGQHCAIDLAPLPSGNDALAAAPGYVATVGWLGDGGFSIELEHYDPEGDVIWRSRYMHLQVFLVQRGQWVARGQVIAKTDNTGTSFGPHLHFAIWASRLSAALAVQPDPKQVYGWWAVDPERLLQDVPIPVPPPTPTPPPPPEEADMKLVRSTNGYCAVVGATGKHFIATSEELGLYQLLLGPPIQLKDANQDRMLASTPDSDTVDNWLRQTVHLQYTDGSTRTLKLRDLISGQTQAMEQYRQRWLLGEENYVGMSPLMGFQKAVRDAE